MRKVKKVLEYHFDAGRSHRDIAMHCGVARRTVALLVERFESSGLGWPEARDMEEGALEAALYPPPPPPPEDVDWAKVEAELSGRGGDAEAAVGGMAGRSSRRHELPDLVPPLPPAAAFAARDDDAPGALPGRAPVRRLRRHDGCRDDRRGLARGADLRCLDGGLGAGLRGGHADPEDRRLVRIARALLPGDGLRAAGGGAGQHQAGGDQAVALRAGC